MSVDDMAPSEVEDTPTPTPETPDEGTPQDGTEIPGYEPPGEDVTGDDRYKHLQAFATQKAQAAKELEQKYTAAEADVQFMDALRSGDQQAFRQIAEAFEADPEAVLRSLGLTEAEIEDATQDGGGDTQFKDPRVDQIIAEQQERETAQIASELSDHIDTLAKENGVELTTRQKKVIWIEAVDNGVTPEGTVKAFKDWLTEDYEPLKQNAVKGYRESKKAPSPPQHGSPGVPHQVPTDTKSRLALANEVAQRAIDSAGT